MKFSYLGNKAYLSWYTQDLLTASLDTVYGREVLCRGYFLETDLAIPMQDLIPFLYRDNQLLLKMTCQQIKDAAQLCQQSEHITTWINIAGPLLADQNLFEKFCINALYPLTVRERQSFVLEICENDIKSNVVVERVSFLKSKGFVIAMDDFGSGYSNLLRLSETQFDIIKLDIKLLDRIPNDIWAASFYRDIVNLCSSSGCMIVSEGVETQIQSDFVRWAGVDLIQGFLYAIPKKFLPLPIKTGL
ncbi:MAG: EAL domain-containing protein (putative c-di-GMP-specific phosphodiesterase class I) [Colwellia sp.]